MRLFRSRLPIISIEPCLPSFAKTPPTGPDWIHEIKHDGFRVLARRDGKKVRLISRKGKDLTYRFPLVVQAVAALPVHSCIIDGEAIISDATGLAVFGLIRSYRNGARATLCAFDLIAQQRSLLGTPSAICRRTARPREAASNRRGEATRRSACTARQSFGGSARRP
jgi:ATP-dependent DNA ligase